MHAICNRTCTLPNGGPLAEKGAPVELPGVNEWNLDKFPVLKHFDRPEGVEDVTPAPTDGEPAPEVKTPKKAKKAKLKAEAKSEAEGGDGLDEGGDGLLEI